MSRIAVGTFGEASRQGRRAKCAQSGNIALCINETASIFTERVRCVCSVEGRCRAHNARNITSHHHSASEFAIYPHTLTQLLLRPRPQNLSPTPKIDSGAGTAPSALIITAHEPILIDIPTLTLSGAGIGIFRRILHFLLIRLPFSLPLAFALHLALEEGLGGPAACFRLLL